MMEHIFVFPLLRMVSEAFLFSGFLCICESLIMGIRQTYDFGAVADKDELIRY